MFSRKTGSKRKKGGSGGDGGSSSRTSEKNRAPSTALGEGVKGKSPLFIAPGSILSGKGSSSVPGSGGEVVGSLPSLPLTDPPTLSAPGTTTVRTATGVKSTPPTTAMGTYDADETSMGGFSMSSIPTMATGGPPTILGASFTSTVSMDSIANKTRDLFQVAAAQGTLGGAAVVATAASVNVKLLRASRDGNLEAVQDLLSPDKGDDDDDGRGGKGKKGKKERKDSASPPLPKPDILFFDSDGRTALHHAASRGHIDVAVALVKGLYGSSPDAINIGDLHGTRPIHYAAARGQTAMTRFLLNAGANPTSKDKDGFTPAHFAAARGHPAIIEVLVELAGSKKEKLAVVSAVDGDGSTPLHWAATARQADAVRALIAAKADVNVRSKDRMTPLHTAARAGDVSVVEALLAAKADPTAQDNRSMTPLAWACAKGHEQAAVVLLGASSDVAGLPDKTGLYPLHWAASSGSLIMVEALVDAGANVDAKDNDNMSVVHIASQYGFSGILGILVKAKAKMDVVDRQGNTGLHFAADAGVLAAAEVLVENGCKVDAVNKDGVTPLHRAAFSRSSTVAGFLLKRKAPVTPIGPDGQIPLHWAAFSGAPVVAEVLLTTKAGTVTTNAQSQEGLTPLMIAAKKGRVDVIRVLLHVDIAKPAWEIGDIHMRDHTGNTALHHAAKAGQIPSLAVLLECKANWRLKNNHGQAPAELAKDVGEQDAADFLNSHGKLPSPFQFFSFALDDSVDVRIVDNDVIKEGGRRYTVFQIRISRETSTYRLWRRHSDFVTLQTDLTKVSASAAKRAVKSMGGSPVGQVWRTLGPAAAENRGKMLQAWLQACLKEEDLANSSVLSEFLLLQQPPTPMKSGYLDKQSSHGLAGMLRMWNRRWFILTHNRLYYYMHEMEPVPIRYIDLALISTVCVGTDEDSIPELASIAESSVGGSRTASRASTGSKRRGRRGRGSKGSKGSRGRRKSSRSSSRGRKRGEDAAAAAARTIILETTLRRYVLMAENAAEAEAWVAAIKVALVNNAGALRATSTAAPLMLETV